MIVGLDFGTTNSGMSLYDGKELRRLPLDPSNENPRIVRTALYVTNEQDVFIGRQAIDRYFEHNVGRPVKLQKVWVGEIEVIADLVYFVQDAYVWADVMSPGRLFLSFKTNLRDQEYSGTVIGQFFYPLEAMVATFLHVTKRRAEKILGQPLRQVVLGRPVHFGRDAKEDSLAQERLLRGAFQAGFEKVYLQREPIAAAYHYATLAEGAQNILVFDFGGGTLDITIMRLGDGARRVLATGGVAIAGDVFDQKLVRARLPKHFGEGSKYGARREMPIPKWIYDSFSNWQTILDLQTPEHRRMLQEMTQTAQRPRDLQALISLVSNNYALKMFDVVEQTKRDLSERFGGMIRLDGPGFDVLELLTRREFENIIRPEYLRIEREVDDTLRASGLKAEQIDGVIRTGGSAEIPLFQQMLQRKFGPDRVHSLDTFGSVVSGLGVMAHGIQEGEIEARAYQRQDLKQEEVAISRPNVSVVDLEMLKRRISLQEDAGEEGAVAKEPALILLTAENQVRVVVVADLAASDEADQEHPAFRATGGEIPPLLSAGTADLEEPLLLVTSRYRFFLSTPRQLLDLEEVGHSLAQLHHFGSREKVYAVARWRAVKEAERLLLVTSLGFVRSYPAEVMARSIEAPVPFAFEQPLPGWPVAVLGVHPRQEVVLLTDGGRGLRYPAGEVPGIGLQLLKRAQEEQIVSALAPNREEQLLLVTDRAYGRRMPAGAVFRSEKANHPGRVLISRRPLRGAGIVAPERPLWVATKGSVMAVAPQAIPTDEASTRSHRLLKLPEGEEVRQVVALHRFPTSPETPFAETA